MEPKRMIPIKFKHRNNTNTSDKRIADAYVKGAKFDVDLVTADGKAVSAHRFVLSMFSKYLEKQLSDAGFDGVIIVPLRDLTYDVLKKVIELLYYREISVTVADKENVMKAVKFLKIADVVDTEAEAFNSRRSALPQVLHKNVPQMAPQSVQPKFLNLQEKNAGMNIQNGAYTPGKRIARSQSAFVSSPQPIVQQRTPNPPRLSTNVSPQLTITKAQPRSVNPDTIRPQVPSHEWAQSSNQAVSKVQIRPIPNQMQNCVSAPKPVVNLQLQTKPLNTMLPPSVTIVPKAVKSNVPLQQQQQQQVQSIKGHVSSQIVGNLPQTLTNIDKSDQIDENCNLLDDDMEIDNMMDPNEVEETTFVERKPKIEIISNEVIKTAQNIFHDDDGSVNLINGGLDSNSSQQNNVIQGDNQFSNSNGIKFETEVSQNNDEHTDSLF